jgi:translation initiation factor IF-2
MLGIARNPLMRIVSNNVLLLRVVVLSLLAALTLVFAANARAGELTTTNTPIANESGGQPVVPAPVKETVPVGPAPVKAPEPVPVKPPEAAEKAPEPAPVAPAPAQPAPVAPTPAPEPVAPAPVKAPEAGPPEAKEKEVAALPKAPEGTTVVPMEKAPEGSASGAQTPPGPQGPAPSSGIVGQAAVGVASAVINSQTTSAGGPGEPPTTAAASGSGPARPGMTPAQLAGDLGWLGPQQVQPGLPAGIASAASSLSVVTRGGPPGGDHGSSAVVSPPASPAPGSAPSGVSGGAATGGAGLSVSGFLTLAGLLLLGAPRAMRRLRLLCRPCLTACFVLIPERPG